MREGGDGEAKRGRGQGRREDRGVGSEADMDGRVEWGGEGCRGGRGVWYLKRGEAKPSRLNSAGMMSRLLDAGRRGSGGEGGGELSP